MCIRDRFFTIVSHFLYLRKNIISCLDSGGNGCLAHGCVRIRGLCAIVLAFVVSGDQISVSQMAIILSLIHILP